MTQSALTSSEFVNDSIARRLTKCCRLGRPIPSAALSKQSFNIFMIWIAGAVGFGYSLRSDIHPKLIRQMHMHRLKNDLNLINLAASHTGTQIENGELISALEGIEQIQQAAASMSTAIKSIMAKENYDEVFRVLLAEDNPSQRILIGNALRKAGFFVAEVGDGNEAIEYIYQMTEPDIIVTDIAMPHCDGNELVNVARTSPMCTHSLVVAMTGRPLNEELRKKVDHVIMKPLDPFILVSELKELLKRRDLAEDSSPEFASPDRLTT